MEQFVVHMIDSECTYAQFVVLIDSKCTYGTICCIGSTVRVHMEQFVVLIDSVHMEHIVVKIDIVSVHMDNLLY